MSNEQKERLKIAIDGPVAVGKSTVGYMLAKRLGYRFVDTGSMYRALTWKVIVSGVALEDEEAVARVAANTGIELCFRPSGAEQEGHYLIDGQDVTQQLRSLPVERGVSLVSKVPGVRGRLVLQQREIAREGGIVMVGRDIGTVVLPDADVKVFLDASPRERACRRYLELQAKGGKADCNSIFEDLLKRDKIDMERGTSPLRPAEDARMIDTEGLTLEQVVNLIIDMVGEAA